VQPADRILRAFLERPQQPSFDRDGATTEEDERMRIEGISLALLDVSQDLAGEFNRWHELDHQPEHLAKPDVALSRRYHAADGLRKAEGTVASECTAGYPAFAVVYSLGGTPDFMDDRVRAGWTDLDLELRRAGRFWNVGDPPRHSSRWRLRAAVGGTSVLVRPQGIPYLPHRSILLFAGQTRLDVPREKSVAWWDGTRRADLLALDGALGILRFDPIEPLDPRMLLHVMLCEHPAQQMLNCLVRADRMNRAMGRYPAHGGVYDDLSVLAYDRIVPFEYDDHVPASAPALAGNSQ
jgi:hypothetical protein